MWEALVQRVLGEVDRRADEIVRFARELLRIPTENHPPGGDELPGQEFLAAKLRALGLEVDMFRPDEVDGLTGHPAYHPTGSSTVVHEYSRRPNLVGRWRGSGLADGRSLIMTGHMDVVPPGDPSAWSHGPWAADIDDEGRIFARGAVDDKGPLVAATMAVHALKGAGVRLRGDVILESVVDEEFGGGNGSLATILRGYAADGVVSVEPSGMAICPTTLGCVSISLEIRGRPAHGFEQWKAANPIDGAVQLLRRLPDWHRLRNQRGCRFPLIARRPVPLPLFARAVSAGANLGGASVPPSCEVTLWLGTGPGERWNEVKVEARRFLEDVASGPDWALDGPARLRRIGRFLEGTHIAEDHPLCGAVERAVSGAGAAPARYECGSSRDLFLYTNHGAMPGLICGPGSVAAAHGPDEFINAKELILATKVYALTMCAWCGADPLGAAGPNKGVSDHRDKA